MATATLAAPRSRTRTFFFRWMAAAFLLILLIIGLAVGWFYSLAKRELPQVDGSTALQGLSGPVTVIRDKLGVPHIRAASFEDLFFAQGFVTAQDRLWQMDASRRFAAGELSEILGPGLLLHDRRQRYLQIREACVRGAAALDPQHRQLLEAYARGVNALIQRSGKNLPIEFKLLGYSPRPWAIEDSLLIGANMDQMLNTQYDLELKREKVINHLNAQEVADLYPATSWRDLPPAQQARPHLEEQLPTRPSQDSEDDEGEQAPTKTSGGSSQFEPNS